MQHIFISYSPKDQQHMTSLRENLLRVGYRPWIDPKPRPGQDWRFAIDDALRSADAVLVVVTPAAAESTYVTYEWALALGRGIPVVPIIFKQARMHPRLQTLEHFDYTAFVDERQFWDYFEREIRRRLDVAPRPDLVSPQQVDIPEPESKQAQPAPRPTYTRSVMPSEPGYYLVMRRGPRLNAMYKLEKDIVSLGRDPDNDIVVDDPEVSRYHLRLTWEGDGYAVDDLDSTNGTRIDGGARINTPVQLRPGQALMLGDTIIMSYEEVA